MKSNQELRSFVTFFAFWISWSVIFALNGAIEALYFGYHWGTAVIFGVGTLLQTVMFLLGWRAVRRAQYHAPPAEARAVSRRTERWGFISGLLSLVMAGLAVTQWVERLSQAQVAVGFKAALTLLVVVHGVGAVLLFREAHAKWKAAGQQAGTAL